MDMQMPVMDGLTAAREIRKMERHKSLPIIAMTANALKEDRERCLAAGMNDHVAKPIEEEALFAALARWREWKHVPDPDGQAASAQTSSSANVPEPLHPAKPAGAAASSEDFERVREALDKLAVAAAHDVRSSIGVLSGYGTLMHGRMDPESAQKTAELLAQMKSSAKDASELVTAWLAAAQALRQPLRPEPVDMGAVASELIAGHLRAQQPAALDAQVSPDMPVALADRKMMETIWRELLDNARKFHRGGDVLQVTVGAERRGAHAEYWIRDNAGGYPARDASRLFQPLQRLHGEDVPGAGLGLFVISHLVARNGGRMWVDPADSRGMCVRFVLPVDGGDNVTY